jgi:leucyl-tRNA synthetase
LSANAKPDDPAWNGDHDGQLSPAARKMQRKLHQTIQRITEDFSGRWHFNTSISALMELVNELYDCEASATRKNLPPRRGLDGAPAPLPLLADAQRKLVLMLAPFAPYLAHELWEVLGERPTCCARRGPSTILRWRRKKKSRSGSR